MSDDERDGIQAAIDDGKTDDQIVALLVKNTGVDEVDARLIVAHRRDPTLAWPDDE